MLEITLYPQLLQEIGNVSSIECPNQVELIGKLALVRLV
jgi:hypothetical protein